MHRPNLDSRFVRGLLSLGVVLGVGATGTYALWTDTVPVSGSTISTGTIDLKVGNRDSVNDFTTMSIGTMVPGNSVAGVVTVSNTGTAPLRYYVDAVASNADTKSLGTALQPKVTTDTAVTGASPSATCAGTNLSNVAASFPLGPTGGSFLGSSGAQRQLNAGASETLCIQATLPAAASSTYQGATTNISFTFRGTSF